MDHRNKYITSIRCFRLLTSLSGHLPALLLFRHRTEWFHGVLSHIPWTCGGQGFGVPRRLPPDLDVGVNSLRVHDFWVLYKQNVTTHYVTIICKAHRVFCHVDVVPVSVVEVQVEVLLLEEGLATQATGPLRGPVLKFGGLLGPENFPLVVEGALEGEAHLVLLQYGEPFVLYDLPDNSGIVTWAWDFEDGGPGPWYYW